MPLFKITTNSKIEDLQSFAEKSSLTIANILGKPESYVMVQVEDEACIMFAGNHQPCALLEIKSLGLPENSTADLSSRLCDFIKQQLEIDTARIYIEFSSPERHMWGWDKRTF